MIKEYIPEHVVFRSRAVHNSLNFLWVRFNASLGDMVP